MRLELTFGPLSPPLSDQLSEVGVHADPKLVLHWQRVADALELVHLEKLVSDTVVREGRKRLMKMITKGLDADATQCKSRVAADLHPNDFGDIDIRDTMGTGNEPDMEEDYRAIVWTTLK